MNWILGGQQRWAGISGLSPEMDFVEAPSQMLEDLLRSPKVLATFARHYKTGEPIPVELVKRMNRASTFLRVGKTAQQNGFAAISFDMYKSNPDKLDPDAICDKDFHRYLFLRMSPGTEHFYASSDTSPNTRRLTTHTCGTKSLPRISFPNLILMIRLPGMHQPAIGAWCLNPALPCRQVNWSKTFWAVRKTWRHSNSG